MADLRSTALSAPSASTPTLPSQTATAPASKKKKKKKSGKKRKHRRQSFVATEDNSSAVESDRPRLSELRSNSENPRDSFYRLGRGNKSSESLESEALLDHRDSGPLQARRQSIQQGLWTNAPQSRFPLSRTPGNRSNSRLNRMGTPTIHDEHDENDSTPLLSGSFWREGARTTGYGTGPTPSIGSRLASVLRRPSGTSSVSSPRRSGDLMRTQSRDHFDDYDVNNPPSVPSSPMLDAARDIADTIYVDQETGETVINVDGIEEQSIEIGPQPPGPGGLLKRMTMAAEEDVCFPQDILSEIAEEDFKRDVGQESVRTHRRRRKKWPDLQILEAWRREEKEERTFDEIRARKVNEPLLVDGRLRPRKVTWHREHDEAPFRFTYFNEEFESTIHSQSISELVQPGQTFEDLFIPKPPIISESSSESEEEFSGQSTLHGNDLDRKTSLASTGQSTIFKSDTFRSSATKDHHSHINTSDPSVDRTTPAPVQSPPSERPVRYGQPPVFWLDVLQPTQTEMAVLAKTFGIHPLTTEDIMTQEAREKVELFKNYYFVTYRSFEQDVNSEDYLEPVNMYVVVFREGILSVSVARPFNTMLAYKTSSISLKLHTPPMSAEGSANYLTIFS
jgi:magnesium transporter